jgi:hypothetical protein
MRIKAAVKRDRLFKGNQAIFTLEMRSEMAAVARMGRGGTRLPLPATRLTS